MCKEYFNSKPRNERLLLNDLTASIAKSNKEYCFAIVEVAIYEGTKMIGKAGNYRVNFLDDSRELDYEVKFYTTNPDK